MTIAKLKLKNKEYIEIEMDYKEKGLALSISGNLENSCGQNHNQIYNEYVIGNPEFTKKDKLARLIEIWEMYHLNELTPGSPKQMEALKGKNFTNTKSIEYLKELGLYIDNGYEYGSEWLMNKIPDETVKEINKLIREW